MVKGRRHRDPSMVACPACGRWVSFSRDTGRLAVHMDPAYAGLTCSASGTAIGKTKNRTPRGECPDCSKTFGLDRDGRVAEHLTSSGRACGGGGKAPMAMERHSTAPRPFGHPRY